MRFGAMNFPVLGVLEEIEAFAALDFDYLELAMDPPGAHHSRLRRERSSIRQALDTHQMGLVCHLPTFVSSADLTEGIRRASVEEITCAMEAAAELGAEKAVLHPGHVRGMGAFVRQTALAYALESLDTLVQRADHLNLPLCIENMFPAYGAFFEPDEFGPLLDRYPAAGMTLDTGHAHIGDPGQARILEYIHRFGNRITHVHVSDNSGEGDDHLPVGDGEIDFATVAACLVEAGYDATVTLEIFTHDRRSLTASRQAIEGLLNPCPAGGPEKA